MLTSYGFFELRTTDEAALLTFLGNHASFGSIKQENGLISAILNEEMDASSFNNDLFKNGIVLSHLVKRKESLEEQFLNLTNHNN